MATASKNGIQYRAFRITHYLKRCKNIDVSNECSSASSYLIYIVASRSRTFAHNWSKHLMFFYAFDTLPTLVTSVLTFSIPVGLWLPNYETRFSD